MINTLGPVRAKFDKMKHEISGLKKQMEEIRAYYKHQNEETRSISEDLIVAFSNIDMENIVELLEELVVYEENDDE